MNSIFNVQTNKDYYFASDTNVSSPYRVIIRDDNLYDNSENEGYINEDESINHYDDNEEGSNIP